jgi:hypothetical protein
MPLSQLVDHITDVADEARWRALYPRADELDTLREQVIEIARNILSREGGEREYHPDPRPRTGKDGDCWQALAESLARQADIPLHTRTAQPSALHVRVSERSSRYEQRNKRRFPSLHAHRGRLARLVARRRHHGRGRRLA